jgi:transcriptional regulator
MYLPRHFAREDRAVVDELLRRYPLAELVSWTGSSLETSTIPLLVDGTSLHGHVARANPHWRTLDGATAVAMFRGPDTYVSPSWYSSKASDPRVVPTWNYEIVHVHGTAVVHDDPEWKESLVRRLTATHEAGRPAPWSVDDAPAEYVARQVGAIVGVELRIERVEAKWKLSQNRPEADARSVADALADGDPGQRAVAAEMRRVLDGRPPA